MTRTERTVSPRAILRDRSESKTGLDRSLRKGGAGGHNWGSMKDERELEEAGYDDEQREVGNKIDTAASSGQIGTSTSEDLKNAQQFRKGAFKGESVDLAAIARTSRGVSTSPPK
ncbi:hypothetical protein BDV98DRAFT_586503 [Pterulicium gracile]|uniref:Hyaluronan/mRNA-binding protein domain-containing protein n=1 Tax=Pterulicium gracile TaxID=1884261 RepID=A0A5C3Q7P8_9AGAR|nr:hypothetical protein BDV98DRAFT_586503 [Pterula gracilis]